MWRSEALPLDVVRVQHFVAWEQHEAAALAVEVAAWDVELWEQAVEVAGIVVAADQRSEDALGDLFFLLVALGVVLDDYSVRGVAVLFEDEHRDALATALVVCQPAIAQVIEFANQAGFTGALAAGYADVVDRGQLAGDAQLAEDRDQGWAGVATSLQLGRDLEHTGYSGFHVFDQGGFHQLLLLKHAQC
ncbi:hypothetical protein PPS11_17391 [Pseudomonas putida S11]|nr:hypothetical protein PPS11_17391 [Pseudomonas putida S11]